MDYLYLSLLSHRENVISIHSSAFCFVRARRRGAGAARARGGMAWPRARAARGAPGGRGGVHARRAQPHEVVLLFSVLQSSLKEHLLTPLNVYSYYS